jgi:hypothetical protein
MLEEIQQYISSQSDEKQSDLRTLHTLLSRLLPQGKLWFDKGLNAENRVVCNPTIGYGSQTLCYANGQQKEFFQIGISGNKTGISVYLIGLKNKKQLTETFGRTIGKATITGYCIKFKRLSEVNAAVLEEAIRYGLNATK